MQNVMVLAASGYVNSLLRTSMSIRIENKVKNHNYIELYVNQGHTNLSGDSVCLDQAAISFNENRLEKEDTSVTAIVTLPQYTE